MVQGYGVFGKAYETMLKNDLHAENSVDHRLMQKMILLEPASYHFLYENVHPECSNMSNHNLYEFAQQLKDSQEVISVQNVMNFTSGIAKGFSCRLEEMLFGGTEKQILERGTNWCADMARVTIVLFKCIGIPARLLYLANPEVAYNGHVITEVFYDGKYGVVDPLNGSAFYDKIPLNALILMNNPGYLNNYPKEYRMLFRAAALSEYDPCDPSNDYSISGINDYYRRLLKTEHNGMWIMGEAAAG